MGLGFESPRAHQNCDILWSVAVFCCLYAKKRARVGIRKARPAANPAGKKCRSTAFFSARERAPTGAPRKSTMNRKEMRTSCFSFCCIQPPKGRFDRYLIKYWKFSDYRSFKIGDSENHAAMRWMNIMQNRRINIDVTDIDNIDKSCIFNFRLDSFHFGQK